MKRIIIIIAFIVLFASCEKEEEAPKFELKGKVYWAYSSTDSLSGIQYYSVYKFINDIYAEQFFVQKGIDGLFTYYGGFDDSCTYTLNYPTLKIYRHKYIYGADNIFQCEFKENSVFIESHDWADMNWVQEDSVLEYELTNSYYDSYYDF